MSLQILPRGGFSDNPEFDARLRRAFRRIEEWSSRPYQIYGTRLLPEIYTAEDFTSHAITAKAMANDFLGVGIYTGLTIEVTRSCKFLVWAWGNVQNTDAATDYNACMFLPVTILGTRNNGRANRAYSPVRAGINDNTSIASFREYYLDHLDLGLDPEEPVDVAFEWGWKVDTATNEDMTINRQSMIVWKFDAPDQNTGTDVAWTKSSQNITAYRVVTGSD